MAIADDSETEARETQWPELRRRIAKVSKRRNYEVLSSSGAGDELLWGVAACGGPIRLETIAAAGIATGLACDFTVRARTHQFNGAELSTAIEEFTERIDRAPLKFSDRVSATCDSGASLVAEAVVWGYAMPRLALDFVSDHGQGIGEDLWWTLLGSLQTLRRNAHEQLSVEDPERLLIAGELGAILAWQLVELPSCGGLKDEALESISDWFDGSGDSVAAALQGAGQYARLTLASALRSRRLAARLKRSISVKRSGPAIDLATWMAAMLRGDGGVALGPNIAPGSEVAADCRPDGLLETAAREIGGPALQTAAQASLGKTNSAGRLAWQVQLPEPGWFDESAGLAVMLPEWDVRRGRLAVHYLADSRQIRLEISGGKSPIIAGDWPTRIWQDEISLKPTTAWNDVCWYSDDDVHYLELEQSYEQDIKVQRQILMLRDDRCLMLADAVIGKPGAPLRYETELPLTSTVHVEEERDTREVYLVDGKRRALFMPLAASEWKVGPTAATLRIADAAEGMRLVVSAKASGALYSPLWLDLDRKRIRSQKTWRDLTIGQQRKLVPKHEATAFRVQVGEDQWVIYRSLNGANNRTFMGKNLISDFFCGRFDTEDGSIEELVSVDEQPD